MKIPIVKQIIDGYIDIQFPFYYEHDLSGDNNDYIIYGKIMEDGVVTIRESKIYDSGEYVYEVEYSPVFDPDSMKSYLLDPEHRSTEEKFNAVYSRMLDRFKQLFGG